MIFKRSSPTTADTQTASVIGGKNKPQGPWSTAFATIPTHRIDPIFYEDMRAAVPLIGTAIEKKVVLDGILEIEGENQQIIDIASEWMQSVRVNDLDCGLQAFANLLGNEFYEQGHGIGEMVINPVTGEIERLCVGDSKGVIYHTTANGELQCWYRNTPPHRTITNQTGHIQIRAQHQHTPTTATTLQKAGYQQIPSERLLYIAHNPEAGNPYGVSMMRSLEFVVKILLTLDTGLLRSWDRYGSPSLNVVLKTGTRNESKQKQIFKDLLKNLQDVMTAKQSGQAADFINVIGANDDLNAEILGGKGEVLEIQEPARHVIEQIVAKTGLPGWLLGLQWNTSDHLASKQLDMVLQDSRTRFMSRSAIYHRIISHVLRQKGLTWEPGDWKIVQRLPSLNDLESQARARMMNAQAEQIESAGSDPDEAPDDNSDNDTDKSVKSHNCKKHDKVEEYAEDQEVLSAMERDIEQSVLPRWQEFTDNVINIIISKSFKAAKSTTQANTKTDTFQFNEINLDNALKAVLDEFIASSSEADRPLVANMVRAYLRGQQNAQAEIGIAAIGSTEFTIDEFTDRAEEIVRDISETSVYNDLLDKLRQQKYDGLNRKQLERALHKRFGQHKFRWTRISRSVVAEVYATGKMVEYAKNDLELYGFNIAGGACPICIAIAEDGPYPVGAGPLPVIDTHGNCRCSVFAVI